MLNRCPPWDGWSMRVEAPLARPRRLALTPLIDIVFLLLVFFMLASTFLRYSRIDVGSSQPGRAVHALAGAQFVRVHAEGRLDLNGAPVTADDLLARLDAKADSPSARVIVRPMDGTHVQDLVSALEHIRKSRIRQIIIAR